MHYSLCGTQTNNRQSGRKKASKVSVSPLHYRRCMRISGRIGTTSFDRLCSPLARMREESVRISAILLRFFVVSISYSRQIAEMSQIGPRCHPFPAIHHHPIFRRYIQSPIYATVVFRDVQCKLTLTQAGILHPYRQMNV